MSHELRTPLNAVIGYSEMMRETAMEQDRPGDASDHTNVIDAARRQLALVNDLLDLAKAEAGKVSLQIETFDVRAMIEEAVATIAPAAAARGNAVRLELDPGLTTAHSDEFRLGQCLLNLLSNAVKFTDNGQIVLRASSRSKRLRLLGVCGGGQRHRNVSSANAETLPALRAGQRGYRAHARRHRPRPIDHAPPGEISRRRHHGGKQARHRLDLHAACASRSTGRRGSEPRKPHAAGGVGATSNR